MPPLLYLELPSPKPSLETLLLYGSLPNVITLTDPKHQEEDLFSYVSTYLEDEIRAEALVRNVGSFSRFLQIAAGESGKQTNFSRLSQDIGISDSTITNYYQILEDCLIVHKIDPITYSASKRRLIKSAKYLFFDLGVRRACAREGIRLPQKIFGDLFEQYVGNELYYLSRLTSAHFKLHYWRDAAGPEVDYVVDTTDELIPIEVKWHQQPSIKHTKHLKKFLNEYERARKAYVVCRSPQRYAISDNIIALPWQDIHTIINN